MLSSNQLFESNGKTDQNSSLNPIKQSKRTFIILPSYFAKKLIKSSILIAQQLIQKKYVSSVPKERQYANGDYNKELFIIYLIEMKLVSVNAVLIASVNISLFVNCFLDQHTFPPLTLFFLSAIFIALIVLLQYEHRHFRQTEVNISQSSALLRKYLLLFANGLVLTLAQKFEWLSGVDHPELKLYTLLGGDIHYSLLYYSLNVILGLVYQFLFKKQYHKANRHRIDWELAPNLSEQNCAICLSRIEEGQKLAKIECMHHYHLVCLNKWVKMKTQCPLCQSQIVLTN